MTDHTAQPEPAVAPRSPKFAQPTVESCVYRQTSASSDDAARCGLLQQISGVSDPQRCMVPREACIACCKSFPPTTERWNPVIASLMLGMIDQIVTDGGLPECSANQVSQLQQQGMMSLDVSRSSDQNIKPLRVDRSCCFLGPARSLGDEHSSTVPTFDCRHPSHDITTEEECRQCRDWSVVPMRSRQMTPAEMVPLNVSRSGPPVRRWSVGVVTAPRREATLEWCLDSIVRAGWDRPSLFIDGLVRIPERYLHLPVTWREQPIGAWPNSYLALVEMIQRDPHADAYLLLQDDAFLYDRGNLREYLEATLWPGDRPGILSLFCPQPYNKTQPGWHTREEPWIWGAQAFLFSQAAAREFVCTQEVFSHRWTGIRDGRVQVDVLVGQWAADHDWPIWFPNPSLAQHVGYTSSIWDDARIAGWRRADWFAGDLESPFARETSWSDFPEHLFPCRDELQPEYQRRLEIGRHRMSQRRVVLCGLCHDVRHFLPKFVARVERQGSMFCDYRVVLVETNSVDATLEFLQDWQRHNVRVHVLSMRLGTIRDPRTHNMDRTVQRAAFRDEYRRFVHEHYNEFDNVLVVDPDLAGGWSDEGLANTFGHDEWDFVGSYGLVRQHTEQSSGWVQFDAEAFRASGHPQPHSVLEVGHSFFDRGEMLLPVLSCLGGLGVYRLPAFVSTVYSGPDNEHVALLERMRQRGFDRLFLNPSQITIYSPE